MSIRFSMLVPVYNAEKYLSACIDSVIKQDYKDFELIMVDDGSVDNSVRIIKDYTQKDSRIKLYTQARSGCFPARLKCIEKATGEYILHIDGDDYWDEGLLSYLSKLVDRSNPDMIVYGYRNVTEEGFVGPPVRTLKIKYDYLYQGTEILNALAPLFMTKLTGVLWNKCIKTSIIDKNIDYSRFNPYMRGQDMVITTPIMLRIKNIYCSDRVFYNYRRSKQHDHGQRKVTDLIDRRKWLYENIKKTYGDSEMLLRCFYEINIMSFVYELKKISLNVNSYAELVEQNQKAKGMIDESLLYLYGNNILKSIGDRLRLNLPAIWMYRFYIGGLRCGSRIKQKIKKGIFLRFQGMVSYFNICG